ncbi:hypothetical protein FHX82_000421 [Amycolatopsis bartoniae]|uniref:Uncharacterized protein n=1 Tax=Amycolatopsis bartoniae TaxID=941986 RepID=A0A8H9IYX2_9PSEU|nr:hypothetical protein [Amycolatopsis bartoniae]MBB2933401.1 hypothetical protein [Amycolatopsis bartoniae]TVT06631.1 hypothetical protein FNH07_19440 [Amycolatopsis bartoniae]GHF59197.1 hypothetical protein GCM10017566_35850 [Amycolatopsis bartoniae]
MSYRFSDPVGAATTARLQLPPDEQLLWAAYNRFAYYYDVDGLDPLGERKKNAVLRGLRAVGGVAGDFASEMLGETDSSSNTPPPAGVFIVGARKEGLATDVLAALGEPGKNLECLWALTARRLVLFGRPPTPEPVSLGKTLFGVGKGLARAVTGNSRKTYGAHTEGQPVVIEQREVVAEVPRARIAGVAPAQRRRKPCLRLSFVDGSGLELLLPVEDPAVFEWMAR